MSLSSHEDFHALIKSILSGDIPSDQHMHRGLSHLSLCASCWQELLALVEMMHDIPKYLENSPQKGNCCLTYLALPRYAENNKAVARQKFPFVWEHLQNCEECREQEEMLRSLIESQDEFGALPGGANTRIIVSDRQGEPRKIRLLQKISVFWCNQKSRISIIKKMTGEMAGQAANSVISTSVLVPACLGPMENEVQAVNYAMPQGLTLSLSIAYQNQLFDLSIVVKLEDKNLGIMQIKLFDTNSPSKFLLAVETRQNGDKCSFRGLYRGNYELLIETKMSNLATAWEIPIELAGADCNGI
jgi:hypothetical protein